MASLSLHQPTGSWCESLETASGLTSRRTSWGRAKTSSDPKLDVVAIIYIPFSKIMFERVILGHLDNGSDCKSTDSADWVEDCRVSTTTSIDTSASLSVVDLHQIAGSAGYSIQISWARQAS